jgi:regulatory protein
MTGDDHAAMTGDDYEAARQIALRRLDARARSEAELTGDLIRRGVTPQTTARVVARLAEVGLVDDAEFARQWVESRQGAKNLSRLRLRQELRAKGVAESVIAQALETEAEDEDEVALEFARRKARTMATLDDAAFQRRLAGQLARRGFPEPVVRRVVFRLTDERTTPGRGDAAISRPPP